MITVKTLADGFLPANKSLNRNPFGLSLLTPQQLKSLPKGTILYCFTGQKVIVGVDYIDDDTRSGFVAFGFRSTHAGQSFNVETTFAD